MGGRIGFDSTWGEGSTFWLELPFEVLAADRRVALADSGLENLEQAAREIPPSSILVAEDNPVSPLLAAEIFRRLGCTVDVVGNGREAVQAFRSRPYDLVFMDCEMPQQNGFDATRAMRQLEADGLRAGEPRTPVIAMTASALQGDPERCFDAGMDDFMSKPLRLSQLTRLLRHGLVAGAEAGQGGAADGQGEGGEKNRETAPEGLSWINHSDPISSPFLGGPGKAWPSIFSPAKT
ncbi:MAG: ATP-binding response regulator [Pseudomonadota bacterium]